MPCHPLTQTQDTVLDSMRAMKVSSKLQGKIVAYYELLWQRHRFLSTSDSFIDELSPPLRKEVHLDLDKVIISKCALFRGLLNVDDDPNIGQFLSNEEAHQILVSIVDGLRPEVYLLGDSVIAQGEMGREMFFLVKGLVDVVKFDTNKQLQAGRKQEQENLRKGRFSHMRNGSNNSILSDLDRADDDDDDDDMHDPLQDVRKISTKLVTLGAGSYFGELALLRDPVKGAYARRAASIIAVTPCDTRIFTKNAFDKIVQDFPGLWMYLSHIAAEKYKMPALKQTSPPGVPSAGTNVGGLTLSDGGSRIRGPASVQMSNQLTRIEKVITAMSRRISNVEKCLHVTPASPPSRSSSYQFSTSPASSNGGSGSRPSRGGRGGGRGTGRRNTRATTGRRLSMPASSGLSSPTAKFNVRDI